MSTHEVLTAVIDSLYREARAAMGEAIQLSEIPSTKPRSRLAMARRDGILQAIRIVRAARVQANRQQFFACTDASGKCPPAAATQPLITSESVL